MGSTFRRLRRASKNDLLYIKTTVLKNNPNDGLFCTFAYPVLYPEGTRSTQIR